MVQETTHRPAGVLNHVQNIYLVGLFKNRSLVFINTKKHRSKFGYFSVRRSTGGPRRPGSTLINRTSRRNFTRTMDALVCAAVSRDLVLSTRFPVDDFQRTKIWAFWYVYKSTIYFHIDVNQLFSHHVSRNVQLILGIRRINFCQRRWSLRNWLERQESETLPPETPLSWEGVRRDQWSLGSNSEMVLVGWYISRPTQTVSLYKENRLIFPIYAIVPDGFILDLDPKIAHVCGPRRDLFAHGSEACVLQVIAWETSC